MTIQVRSNEPITPPTADASASSEGAAIESKESQTSAPEAKASEQNESSESETEETEATSGEESEQSETQDLENKEQPKKKGGFQRRIDKLNAAKADAQREAEFWKQQALKHASGAKAEPEMSRATNTTAATEGKPVPDRFETHTEYVEALADWKTEQKLKERDQRAEQTRLESEQSKIVNTYNERVKSFAEKKADFSEVLSEVDHVPLSPALRDIILTSDNGPELAYELARNPQEYERIAQLPPLACAREMGKLEARLNSSSKTSAATPEKKITQAPKPIEPVGTGGKGSAQKSIYDAHLSQADYERLRKEQIKKRRQA